MSALGRIGRRWFVRRHPAQLLLAVLGIAVGVAAVVAIDLANASATRAFDLTVESLAGRATHRIVGGAAGVPDDVYRQLRTAGATNTAPVVEGTCRVVRAGARGTTLRVLGIDPLAEAPLRAHLAAFAGGRATFDVGRLIREPGTVVTNAATARALGLERDFPFLVEADGFSCDLVSIGEIAPTDPVAARGLDFVLVTDIGTAQDLLRRSGRLDRIDLVASAAVAERLAATLAPPLRLEPSAKNRGVLAELTRAFRLNLQAMGLLALLVGAFLIHNTMQFAVVQRRALFGVLRAVGATPGQLLRAVLGEALGIGVFATVLGIGLGVLLADRLLLLVSRTIDDLYFAMSVSTVVIEPWPLAKAALLGLGACFVAAFGPAREAVRVTPREAILRSALEQKLRGRLPLAVAGAVLSIAVGGLAIGVTERSIPLAYVGILAILVGCAVAVPPSTAALLVALRIPARAMFGFAGDYAARSAARGLSRTAFATAALMLAVAATVGLGAMIQSFRGTVATWLESTLAADVFVAPPSTIANRTDPRLDEATRIRLAAVDGVLGTSTIRRITATTVDDTELELAAVEPGPGTLATFTWVDGNDAAAERVFATGDALLVSEPLAWRLTLAVGDTLTLRTDHGVATLPVLGIFRDYAAERGWALIAREGFERRYDDRAIGGIAFWARPDVGPELLFERIRAAADGCDQALSVQRSGALRDASLAVFDRTFAITDVLRLLCVLVAVLGIWSALAALQLERGRETGLLRAVGATPGQVATSLMIQNALLGLCAGVLAIPTGALLAWLLVTVVNRRSFGWTLLEFDVPPATIAQAVGLAVAAAVVAGIWPALRARRTAIGAALRDE